MPTTIPELITWCNTHVDLWNLNAPQIGLAPSQASAFKAAVADMVTASADADTARQDSKDKTMALHAAMGTVRTLGAANIGIIKAYAETTHNMNVYALAGVSPNDPPSTLPAPSAPQQFTAGVNSDGSLTIKWKVSQPTGVSGVTYIVSRRVNGGDGPFTIVANEGSNKTFIDTTLPIGVDRVEYMVTPKRGMDYGVQSPVFSIQFGSVGGGGMLVSTVDHAEPMKIAA
jgi:hypothetical protein